MVEFSFILNLMSHLEFCDESCSTWNGPKFDGVYLHKLTDELLKETRLNQTLTKVVIPTFDLKKLKPVIFSSYKVN